jgi:hypothetical protein
LETAMAMIVSFKIFHGRFDKRSQQYVEAQVRPFPLTLNPKP